MSEFIEFYSLGLPISSNPEAQFVENTGNEGMSDSGEARVPVPRQPIPRMAYFYDGKFYSCDEEIKQEVMKKIMAKKDTHKHEIDPDKTDVLGSKEMDEEGSETFHTGAPESSKDLSKLVDEDPVDIKLPNVVEDEPEVVEKIQIVRQPVNVAVHGRKKVEGESKHEPEVVEKIQIVRQPVNVVVHGRKEVARTSKGWQIGAIFPTEESKILEQESKVMKNEPKIIVNEHKLTMNEDKGNEEQQQVNWGFQVSNSFYEELEVVQEKSKVVENVPNEVGAGFLKDPVHDGPPLPKTPPKLFGKYIPVKILEVEAPWEFFVMRKEMLTPRDELTKQMKIWYDGYHHQGHRLKFKDIRLWGYYAAQLLYPPKYAGKWFRVLVTKKPPDPNAPLMNGVECVLIDYGGSPEFVECSKLQPLRQEFAKLPWAIYKGCIKTINNKEFKGSMGGGHDAAINFRAMVMENRGEFLGMLIDEVKPDRDNNYPFITWEIFIRDC